MRLVTLCARFSRQVYCHVPAETRFDIRELASADEPERWSDGDLPTIYLAGDVGVALAELGRHAPRLPPEGQFELRWLMRVGISLDRVIDLTRPEVQRALRIESAPWIFTEPAHARAVARAVRESGDCDAMIVPSVAFLDRPDRWNLVVFAERLTDGLEGAIGSPVPVGDVRIGVEEALIED
jgi:RES domain-containing protein